MSFNSLETRLMFAVGTLAVAAVCAVAFSARHLTHVEFGKYQQYEQTRISAQRTANAVSRLAGRCCTTEATRWAVAELAQDQALIIVAADGRLITVSGPGVAAANLRQVQIHLEKGVLRIAGLQQEAGLPRKMILQVPASESSPVVLTNGRSARAYVIQVPHLDALEPTSSFLESVDRRLLVATILAGVFALGFTWLIARRITSPIGELKGAAHELARGNLARRVTVHGSDEVAALARTFNAMAAQLERQQKLQRHLMQDIAHEFRTPLAALQCLLETLLDGFAVDEHHTLLEAGEAVRHLTRLLEDLHEIAIAEAGQLELRVSEVSISDIVRSAVRFAGLEHETRLRLDVDPTLNVHADPVRARQVVINLLNNAGQYTPSGGAITVRAYRSAQAIRVEVSNTGSSLDAEQLQYVFDRFYRADPARQRATGGTGLGLTIVKYLVEAHGGSVSASSDAGSVTISFTLPAPPKSLDRVY